MAWHLYIWPHKETMLMQHEFFFLAELQLMTSQWITSQHCTWLLTVDMRKSLNYYWIGKIMRNLSHSDLMISPDLLKNRQNILATAKKDE